MPSGETLVYSSRARTLVDAVYEWSQFDSLPEACDWIRSDLAAGRITADELARAAVRYGNMGAAKTAADQPLAERHAEMASMASRPPFVEFQNHRAVRHVSHMP